MRGLSRGVAPLRGKLPPDRLPSVGPPALCSAAAAPSVIHGPREDALPPEDGRLPGSRTSFITSPDAISSARCACASISLGGLGTGDPAGCGLGSSTMAPHRLVPHQPRPLCTSVSLEECHDVTNGTFGTGRVHSTLHSCIALFSYSE